MSILYGVRTVVLTGTMAQDAREGDRHTKHFRVRLHLSEERKTAQHTKLTVRVTGLMLMGRFGKH